MVKPIFQSKGFLSLNANPRSFIRPWLNNLRNSSGSNFTHRVQGFGLENTEVNPFPILMEVAWGNLMYTKNSSSKTWASTSMIMGGRAIWNLDEFGTLLGTNISLSKAVLKMSFLFPRWDMLIPWRVLHPVFPRSDITQDLWPSERGAQYLHLAHSTSFVAWSQHLRQTSEQWKKTLLAWVIQGIILPNYIGIEINHYKDPGSLLTYQYNRK